MRVPLPSSTALYCGNKVAIYIAQNSVFVERKKHIEIARRYKLGAGGVLDLIGKLYAMRDWGE